MTRRLLFTALALLLAAARAHAQPFLYSLTNTPQCVANQPCPGPRLLVTNVKTGELVNPDDPALFAGEEGVARALATSVDGTRAYVTVDPSLRGRVAPARMIVINTATNRPIDSIPLPDAPWILVPSPDGRLLYGTSPQQDLLMVIDLTSNRLIRQAVVEHAHALAISADGSMLAVAEPRPSVVSLVDTSSLTVRFRAPVPNYPQRIAMSSDARRIYAATSAGLAGGRIVTIDTGSGVVTTRASGDWLPERLLVTPDDKKVYVTFTRRGAWGVMSPTGDVTLHPAAVPGGASMVPSADWRYLYIQADEGVLVVNTATDTVERTLPGGRELTMSLAPLCEFTLPPQDVVFGPAGGTGSISIPAPAGCEWAVQNVPDGNTVRLTSPTSGVGPAMLTYTVPPGSNPRATGIRIAGQTTHLSVVVPDLWIDAPARGATVRLPFVVAGWTLERALAATGSGIDAVHVWAFPTSGGTPTFLGAASYGDSRPDVGGAFGAAYANSGFHQEVPWLTPGSYHIAAYGHSAATGAFSISRAVTVTVTGESRAMALDLPVDSQTIDAASRRIIFGGWAFDRAAAAGTGVDVIHVWAFPIDGGTPRFLGAAVNGIERPDVAGVYGERFRRSGFVASLTKPPAGTYWIAVYAHSVASGRFEQSRVVRVTIVP
jgi:DNA-binding beta-propeller fold protein YncE